MTTAEKAKRYDALIMALGFHEKRYERLSEDLDPKTEAIKWQRIDYFEYGKAKAYGYVAEDLRMMLQE